MGKTSSVAKKKYNQSAYRRYEFNVGLDKKLNYCLEDYKKKGGNVSELIKMSLSEYFGIDCDEEYFPMKYDRKTGKLIQTKNL